MSNKQKIHEPLFHISKRASMPWYFSWLIRLGSILAALIVSGAVTMLLTHQNPISVYATMIDGALVHREGFGIFFKALQFYFALRLR